MGGHATFTGTPGQIADTWAHYVRTRAVDGFNITPHLLPSSLADIVGKVVPELQARGVLARTGRRGVAQLSRIGPRGGKSRENGPVIYRFAVGRLSCAVISDGQMAPPWEPPLAAFFTPASGVPDHELRAAPAAEGRQKTTLSCGYNCVLVQTSDGHAVIDTGLGARFLGYGPRIEPLVGKLGDGLASAGAPAAELAAVVFTHLHQDHCRGATWSGDLTFSRATGFAHAAEVAFWSGADATGGTADEHLASAREAIRLFGDRLLPFDHDSEILPGVRTVDAAGHTPGHSAVLLQSDGERLLCVGDLFYDQLQLSRPEWSTPWDHDAVRAVRTRRRLLDRAADEHLLVHAYHMPFPGLGMITRQGNAYRWQPLRHDESGHTPTIGP